MLHILKVMAAIIGHNPSLKFFTIERKKVLAKINVPGIQRRLPYDIA
ncbi:MAG: hypothetical protein HY562_00165 [Ignavibacteriales bacterium]|nr:hypothetical protein [Ignavibacteriales bacterium]